MENVANFGMDMGIAVAANTSDVGKINGMVNVVNFGMDIGIAGAANTCDVGKINGFSRSSQAVLDIKSSARKSYASSSDLNDFAQPAAGDGVASTNITIGVEGMLSGSSEQSKFGDTISSSRIVQPASVDSPLVRRLQLVNKLLLLLLKTGMATASASISQSEMPSPTG